MKVLAQWVRGESLASAFLSYDYTSLGDNLYFNICAVIAAPKSNKNKIYKVGLSCAKLNSSWLQAFLFPIKR